MTHVLAEIGSDRILAAVIVGIPVALAVLMVLWIAPRRVGPLHVLATLVVVGAVVVGMWAAFASKGREEANSPPVPAGGTQFPTFAPPSGPGPSGAPSPSPSPSAPSCSPGSSTTIAVTAPVGASVAGFAETCLGAPAGKDLTVTFKNNDTGIQHTWALFKDASAADRLGGAPSASDFIVGPAEATYQVNALPAGTYFFRCDIHPTVMTGTFVVG